MWIDPIYALPLDAATVWIRRQGWHAKPMKATWSSSTAEFSLIGTTDILPPSEVPNTLSISWTLISAWRPL